MARFYLVNNVAVGTSRLYAGSLIDDAVENVADIRGAGGVLVHENNGFVADAAAEAQARRRNGDDRAGPLLMLAALAGAADQTQKGANLTNADATIQWAEGRRRVLPAATLSANRALTFGVAGTPAPKRGARITVTRLDAGAFTYAFINGGPAAGTLVTLPVSVPGFVTAEFDGTNWEIAELGRL